MKRKDLEIFITIIVITFFINFFIDLPTEIKLNIVNIAIIMALANVGLRHVVADIYRIFKKN